MEPLEDEGGLVGPLGDEDDVPVWRGFGECAQQILLAGDAPPPRSGGARLVPSVAPPLFCLRGPCLSLEAALVLGNGVSGAVACGLHDTVGVRVAAGGGEDGGKALRISFFA